MKKKVSISDIAKSLGVSVTTVSFILNGKAKEKRISDALTQRVLEYVNKVGYRPNKSAKSLGAGRSKVFGLLVEDMSISFFAKVADQLEKQAYEFGYHIVHCSTHNDVNRAKELIQLFCDRQIDGFIIAPTDGLSGVVQRLLKDNIPVVLFNEYLNDVETNYVVSENRNGSYLGTRFLLEEKSAARVGLVTISSNQVQMRGRMDGYMQAVDEFGKDVLIKKIARIQDGDETIVQIKDFVQDNRLDGVIFATNCLAISGVKAIKRFDITIDKLVSFDESTVFDIVDPAVSVITQNISEIARQIVNILVAEVNGKNKGLVQVAVPCGLITQ